MRKTLTIVAVVFAAGSLAACKPFWEKDPPPAPTATATDPTATTTDASNPPEQTASTETDKPTHKIEVPATPAIK